MKILLSNDDGFHATGLRSLAEALQSIGDVMVAAPNHERSAVGHGITVHDPLRITYQPLIPSLQDSFMTNGTPADCVKLAVQALGWRPDLVISGINSGANLGTDVLYSGTVSAAMEGLILGFPAIAVSLCGTSPSGFEDAAAVVSRMLQNDLLPLRKDTLYNVNIPDGISCSNPPELRFTRQGMRIYNNMFEERRDPKGIPYYWLGGTSSAADNGPGIDMAAIADGCISVTPLRPDLTNCSVLQELPRSVAFD